MVMHAAEKAGIFVPHFCYHKKLSIVASCRMCLVDIEKQPKPVPACATPALPGMVVRTKSVKTVEAQKGVMEFLLINHPLDCPRPASACCKTWLWATAAAIHGTKRKNAYTRPKMLAHSSP